MRRLALVWAAACTVPQTETDARTCPDGPLPAGEVAAGEARCPEVRFATGDGTGSDLFLANSSLRAIVRSPQQALTLAGLGGGTLVDVAPWGRPDGLVEVAPLVGGGWLLVDGLVVGTDSLEITGTVRALPARPLANEGSRRTVTWRLPPDVPWLELEGADGLWLHPEGDVAVRRGWVDTGSVVYGHDGRVVEDLGGALRIDDVTRLVVAAPEEAYRHHPDGFLEVDGSAPGASQLLAYAGDEVVARLPVVDDRFAGAVPRDADALIAFANGRRPSPPVPATSGATLELGGEGSVRIDLAWPPGVAPRPVTVSWEDGDRRQGSVRIEPTGEVLALGDGRLRLTLDAGPTTRSRVLDVDIPEGQEVPLGVRLGADVIAGSWIAASLDWTDARSRRVRASSAARIRDALADGLSYVVSVADDDIGRTRTFLQDAAWMRWSDGARLHHPDGWSLTTWPLSRIDRRSGGGITRIDDLDALDALRVARGGVRLRPVIADLAWLDAAILLDPARTQLPDLVRLPSPGTGLDRWQRWIDLLDDARFVLPSGPVLWLDVEAPSTYGQVDIERAIARGKLCAGTGAWLDLDVAGAHAGEVVTPTPTAAVEAVVHLQTASRSLAQVALLTTDGIVATWPVEQADLTVQQSIVVPSWVLAVAWTPEGDWVASAPVWVVPPVVPGDRGDTADTGVAP